MRRHTGQKTHTLKVVEFPSLLKMGCKSASSCTPFLKGSETPHLMRFFAGFLAKIRPQHNVKNLEKQSQHHLEKSTTVL